MTSPLRVGFAGTPPFAQVALAALLNAGHQVPLVLTQPDRPAGRGLKLQPSAVKSLAQSHGLSVAQPRGLKLDGRHAADAAAAQAALQAARPDVLVVAAYGLILPVWALALPRLGCLNIHASLLPRWRGAAPIQRAIEAGDARTGITIMQMDAGLDTGATLLAEPLEIRADDSAASLHDRLAPLGGRLIVEAMQRAANGRLEPVPQADDGVCYAQKLDRAEAPIDWAAPAAAIERRIRAFDPFPGATTVLDGEAVKVWRAQIAGRSAAGATPGTRLPADDGAILIACGADGGEALGLTELQRPGGKRVSVQQFLNSRPR